MYTFHRFRPCVHTLAPRAGDKRSVHWSCSPHGPGLISVSGHKREKKCLESNYTHKHTWVEVSSLCQWVCESEPFSHQDLSIHYSVLGKFSGLLSITSPWWNRHSWPNTLYQVQLNELLFYKGSKARPTQDFLFLNQMFIAVVVLLKIHYVKVILLKKPKPNFHMISFSTYELCYCQVVIKDMAR